MTPSVTQAACAFSLLVATIATASPDHPEPGRDKNWARTHRAMVQRAKAGEIDLHFLGDSITANWTTTGRAFWHLDLLPQKAANFGIAADRVENILYRIKNCELPSAAPRLYILMAGTNNLAKNDPDTPTDVAKGIEKITSTILKKQPGTQILLLSILPSGYQPDSNLRTTIRETNQKIKPLAKHKKIHFLNVNTHFLTKTREWKPHLTIDGTHLSPEGYEILLKQLMPKIKSIQKKINPNSPTP